MRRVPGPAGPPPTPRGGVRRCLAPWPAGPARTCRADTGLPADTVPAGAGAETAAAALPGPPDPDRAAVGKAVEEGPQPRLAGAEDRQFHPGLRVQGRVVAVAGPEGHIAPGEQRVNDLVLSASLAAGPTPPRRVIVIWPPNTWQKGDGPLGATGEEQIGTGRNGHSGTLSGRLPARPGLSQGACLCWRIRFTARAATIGAASLHRRETLAVKAASGAQNA